MEDEYQAVAPRLVRLPEDAGNLGYLGILTSLHEIANPWDSGEIIGEDCLIGILMPENNFHVVDLRTVPLSSVCEGLPVHASVKSVGGEFHAAYQRSVDMAAEVTVLTAIRSLADFSLHVPHTGRPLRPER